ncbi:MAG: hypothetical protein OEW26_05785 [Nitrospirota bacterium]|nr:hypothetical protein [Nitrospirota bacterium]
MSVYNSGAFLQQCFSVHPLSLDLKLVALPDIVGVVCTNCRMRHRLTLHQVIASPTDNTKSGSNELVLLQQCFHGHPEDVRLSSVHIERHAVEFRCRPCRRTSVLDVALIETRQF